MILLAAHVFATLPFICALPLLSLLPGRQPRLSHVVALYVAFLLTVYLLTRP
jgi:hypothetical protein